MSYIKIQIEAQPEVMSRFDRRSLEAEVMVDIETQPPVPQALLPDMVIALRKLAEQIEKLLDAPPRGRAQMGATHSRDH